MNSRPIAGVALGWALLCTSHDAFSQVTGRISVDSSGGEGNGFSTTSLGPTISDNGRFVLFSSLATNLVPGDTNSSFDAFVRDRQLGTTTRVSVDSSAVEGDADSTVSSISADGRYVAFRSLASNLIGADTNNLHDLFVHDRDTGATTRVSVDSSGTETDGSSNHGWISADGRYVTFSSLATNLVAGDSNLEQDIFVHDRQTGTTERVSVDSAGVQGNGSSYFPSISEDGNCVAFASNSTNLVAGDTNSEYDIFVHDRQSGATTRVNIDSSGLQANAVSRTPSISRDGRFVEFTSRATNLVSGDTNNADDVFVRDRLTSSISRVNVDSAGNQANTSTVGATISGDGRFVSFESRDSDLVSGDTNDKYDVFVHDRQEGTTTRVSVSSTGMESDEDCMFPTISADGRYVAFRSLTADLVADDTNGEYDKFIHGPSLTLEASPDTVSAGDPITIITWTGLSSGLVYLVLVEVNGSPWFQLVLGGSFDAQGVWSLPGSVPAGLAGNLLTFKSLGFGATGLIELSNAELITFQ